MKILGLGLILASLSTIAQAGEPPPDGDLGKLQGRWSARVGPRDDIRVDLEVEGGRAKVVITTPQGLTIRARGQIKIDDSVEPRALDWADFRSLDGQPLPQIQAIYRIDERAWTVCNGGPNGSRPSEFRPGDNLLAGVVTFARAEARPSAAAPDASPDSAAGGR